MIAIVPDDSAVSLDAMLRGAVAGWRGYERNHPAADLLIHWDELRTALPACGLRRIHLPRYAGFGQWAAAWIVQQISHGGFAEEPARRLLAYVLAEARGETLLSPLHCRPRSVFLAACRRRRDGPKQWVADLFEESCRKPDLDPRTDVVLDTSGRFAPELELLRRDAAAYRRDLRRATRMAAFLDCPGERRVHEALWIDAPESVLFADRAWRDAEASEDGRGFALVVVEQEHGGEQIALSPRVDVRLCSLADTLCPRPAIAPEQALDEGGNVQRSLSDSVEGWWSLRRDRTEIRADLEKKLREELEGRLFDPPAIWEQDLSLLRPRQPDRVEIHQLSYFVCKLADLGKADNYRLPKSAVKAIGGALSTLVREERDERPGAGPDLAKKHRQGDSGFLTVWSRKGIAAAYTPGAKAAALRGLRNAFAEMAQLVHENTEALAGNSRRPAARESESSKLDRLIERNAAIQTKMATPGYRLLRRLFRRLDISELQERIYEQHNRSDRDELQKHVHTIELVVVSYYFFECAHIILGTSPGSAFGHAVIGIPVATAVGIAAWWYMSRSHGEKPGWKMMLGACGGIVLALAVLLSIAYLIERVTPLPHTQQSAFVRADGESAAEVAAPAPDQGATNPGAGKRER